MITTVEALPPAEFFDWLQQSSSTTTAGTGEALLKQ